MTTKFGYSEITGTIGPRGPQGKGISNITYDDPNDQLVITYDDSTTTNIPFPGISLDTTANIRAYGANNANKLRIQDNSNNDIFNVNTTTGIITATKPQNGVTSDCLILSNTGTGASTGTGIQFGGHNGSSVTSGSIQLSGGNMTYLNNNSPGFHIFNKAILPSADLGSSCGNAFNRWSSLFSYNGNFGGTVNINGDNLSGKLRVSDNSSNTIFDVDTTSNLVSITNCNLSGLTSVIGFNDTVKFRVVDNSNNTIFSVNTINGIVSVTNSNSTQLRLTTSGSIAGIGFNTFGGFSKNISMMSGVFSVDGAFAPSVNQTYDLGGSLQRWNTVFGSQIDLNGSITSSSGSNGTAPNRLTLTNSGTGANTGVTISMNGHDGTSARNGTITFSNTSLTFTIPSGGNYIFNSIVRPSTTGTLTLGSSSNRWSTLFCTAVDSSGTGTFSAANNASVATRLTLTNSGTGAGTGTQITFNGHNGTAATNGNIQHNGTHLLYNASTGGDHAFNSTVRPITDGVGSCGTSTNRWTALWTTASAINTSDQREKNSITDEDLGLDFIGQLRPVKFKYNAIRNEIVYTNVPRVDENGNPVYEQIPSLNENGDYIYDENGNQLFENGNQIIDVIQTIVPVAGTQFNHGLIAQELDTVLTNNNLTNNDFAGLNKDNPNRYGIAYTELIAPMIKAIKELKQIVETQQETINDLQDQINQILN